MDLMGLSIRLIFMLFAMVLAQFLFSQSAHREWRQADKLFDKEEYELAEKKYRSASEKKSDPALHYNRGNALFELEDYEGAIEEYESSLSIPDASKDLKFQSHFNKGNAHVKMGAWKEAIKDYQEALKLDPEHEPSRKNLWRAMQQLPPPQEQPQKGNEGEENKNEQEKEDENTSPEMQEKAEEDKPADNPQSAENRPLTEEELERLMQAIEREDARVQEERKRERKGKKSRPLKDW
jgi:tetratricopeptide (TPR) repeat protein